MVNGCAEVFVSIKRQKVFLWQMLLLGALAIVLSACSTTPQFIASRINPLPKRTVDSIVLNDIIPNPVPVNHPIAITSAHTDPDGVRDVEFFVNGKLVAIENPPFSQTFFKVTTVYTPTQPGEYTFTLRANPVNPNVNPSEKTVKIKVVEAGALPPSSAAAVTPTPTPMVIACQKNAALVEDVTVPPGTAIQPGETFVKTWRIKNSGTCDWRAGYYLDLVEGQAFGAARTTVPAVPALASTEISLNMTAPTLSGTYRGVWQMFDPAGKPFGQKFTVEFVVPKACQNPEITLFTAQPGVISAGQSSILQWTVTGAKEIAITPNVGVPGNNNSLTVTPQTTTQYTLTATDGECVSTAQTTVTVSQPTTLIDFIQTANLATWQTDTGAPITFGNDPRALTPPQFSVAYVLWRDTVVLQNGDTAARVLEINPASSAFVQGVYTFNLAGGTQPTDVVEVKMAFLNGATVSNGATYGVIFVPVGQPPVQLGALAVNPNGVPVTASFPLTNVPAGSQGQFILQANYGANITDAVAVWVTAALKRP